MRRMTQFYKSPYGLLSSAEVILRMRPDAENFTAMQLEAIVKLHTSIQHTFWSDPETMVLLADDPFAEMMQAAAIDAPDGPIANDELPSRSGVIFFRQERHIADFGGDPIRAITWLIRDGTVFAQGLVDGHHEADTPAEEIEPPREIYAYFHARLLLQTDVGKPSIAGEQAVQFLRFLRSINAISKSAHTKVEDESVQARVKGRKSRHREMIDGRVRTLSLHNPDYGRYELDAATGTHVRQHWVRGHWRNQWYSRERVNRSFWIDGFVRGDASVGVVSGQKVYVVKGADTAPPPAPDRT